MADTALAVEKTKQVNGRREKSLPGRIHELKKVAEAAVERLQSVAKDEGERLKIMAAEVEAAVRKYDASAREEQGKVRTALATLSGGGVERMARACPDEGIKEVLRRNGWRV